MPRPAGQGHIDHPHPAPDPALDRVPGEQPGAPGAHLAAVTDPDEVVVGRPRACTCCGADLSVKLLNNYAGSERRMAKHYRKISGSSRAVHGPARLAKARSSISTASKHGVGALVVLTPPFAREPWMPTAPTRG
ncbi:MAG: hypothetical protein M0Z82_12000 [Actinomycetota bacterium]|nr:hypothetical protein [Actinomycetota bacterium]